MGILNRITKRGFLDYLLETIKDAMDDHIRYSTVIVDPKTGALYDRIKLREGLMVVSAETTYLDPEIRSLDFFWIKHIKISDDEEHEDLVYEKIGEVFCVMTGTDEDIYWEKVKAIPNYLEICANIFKKTEHIVYTKEAAEKARKEDEAKKLKIAEISKKDSETIKRMR